MALIAMPVEMHVFAHCKAKAIFWPSKWRHFGRTNVTKSGFDQLVLLYQLIGGRLLIGDVNDGQSNESGIRRSGSKRFGREPLTKIIFTPQMD